jgi:hypothetical protein
MPRRGMPRKIFFTRLSQVEGSTYASSAGDEESIEYMHLPARDDLRVIETFISARGERC